MILNVHLCVKILFFYRLKFILFELNKETPMNIEIPLKMMIERAIYARISLLLFCIVMKFRILYRLLHNEYIYTYIYTLRAINCEISASSFFPRESQREHAVGTHKFLLRYASFYSSLPGKRDAPLHPVQWSLYS